METKGKVCKTCSDWKPLDQFGKVKRMKDGHRNECKVCYSNRNKKYHMENNNTLERKEKRREYNKQYHKQVVEKRTKNREQLYQERLDYQKKWREHICTPYVADDKTGMSEETFLHIRNNLHLLDLDVENGLILNRKCSLSKAGYPRIALNGKLVYVHQVMGVVRWRRSCIGLTINHVNEIKTDNRWFNLELMTQSNNASIRTQKYTDGSRHKAVVAVDESGKESVFESISEACRTLDLDKSSVIKVLKGEYKQTKGYRSKNWV